MKKIITVWTILFLVVLSIQFDQTNVGAAPAPLTAIDASVVGLSFSVPNYFYSTTNPHYTNNSCVGFTASTVTALIQGCRFANDNQTLDQEWAGVKQSTVDGTTFTFFGDDGSSPNNYITLNGINGEIGIFFYHGKTANMANMLFVGHDTNGDVVAMIFQEDLSYADGAQDAYNAINTFHVLGGTQ